MSSSSEAAKDGATESPSHLKTAKYPSKYGGETAFIAEHGRLPRPIEDAAFDPFRRKVIKVPATVNLLMRLCSLFLFPFRLTVIFWAVLISYILAKVFGPPITADTVANFDAPLVAPWRRKITKFANQLLGRMLLLALGFWTVEGSDDDAYVHREALKATIVSNHASLADPCLLAYLFAPSFVAKSAVWMIPGVGLVGATHHAFYIDRMHGSKLSIAEKIAERQKMVVEHEGALPPVAIFPEGTTTNGDHLLKFRTGAFIAGTPVVPVLIRYSYRWFSPCYESIKTGKYVLGLLMQFSNHVRYHRLPVYYPSQEEKNDPGLYAQNVYSLILRESERVFGQAFTPSESNLVDKIEYNSIFRGDKLKKGLKLNT